MKKYLFGTVCVAILAALGLFACVFNAVNGNGNSVTLCNIAIYALLVFYAAWGYKKPHGNLLKYLMIAYALTLISLIVMQARMGLFVNVAILSVAAMMVTYIAGRLDRIEKNRYIAVAVLLLQAATRAITLVKFDLDLDFIFGVTVFSNLIQWVALCAAYFTRFGQHKKAGLADSAQEN